MCFMGWPWLCSSLEDANWQISPYLVIFFFHVSKGKCLVAQPRLTLQPTRLICPWEFYRQESWSGLPCSPPGDLPNPGIEPRSPTLPEKAMASHSSTLAWRIPWTEEPGRLQSMWLLGVGHDWVTSLSLSLSCIGEGNGNPLQCSCLENPRDGGAW